MSAPERIWLLWADGTVQDRYHASAKDHTEEGGYPEFIRADLHEAAVAAARAEGMREAAAIARAQAHASPYLDGKTAAYSVGMNDGFEAAAQAVEFAAEASK